MNVPLAGMHGPTWTTHMSTLSGQTQLVTPLAKSTPVFTNTCNTTWKNAHCGRYIRASLH